METQKRSKSEQARINGSKSKGPITEAGRSRVRAVNIKHGLFAVNATVLDIESREAFRVLRDAAFAQWRPRNAWEAQYVEEIADCSWRIARLRLCASHDSNVSIKRLRQAAEHPLQWMDAVTQTEVAASTANGAQTLLQRRVNALIGNRLKVTAELRALQNVISLGTSQDLLITQGLPAGTSQETPHGYPPETQNNPALTQKQPK